MAKINQIHIVTNKSIMKIPTRRTILIVQDEEHVSSLRVGGRKKKKRKKLAVTSLLYQEYDDADNLLNEFWMYNLEDVSIFFKQYLETEVCYGTCKGENDDDKNAATEVVDT